MLEKLVFLIDREKKDRQQEAFKPYSLKVS